MSDHAQSGDLDYRSRKSADDFDVYGPDELTALRKESVAQVGEIERLKQERDAERERAEKARLIVTEALGCCDSTLPWDYLCECIKMRQQRTDAAESRLKELEADLASSPGSALLAKVKAAEGLAEAVRELLERINFGGSSETQYAAASAALSAYESASTGPIPKTSSIRSVTLDFRFGF